MNSKTSTPSINYTLKHDICTGCGICVGSCPSGAIRTIIKAGRFIPSIDDSKCRNSKGCHRCYDACPGVGVDLLGYATETSKTHYDKLIGRYYACYAGYSADQDLRYHAASGGVLSQCLIWLLENNKIDGAVVTKFDKECPLKVKSFIARTKSDILSAKSSKYSPVSLHEAVKELKEAPDGRYVVVGIPCHIQGFRKIEKIDKILSDKIVGHFAIFCSASRTFNFTEYVMRERNINLDNVDYLAYRDRGNQGGLVVQGKGIDYYQDYRKYCHPLKSIFIPRRCLLCIDHYGEMSDISFGDINVAPYNEDKIGISSVIVRNASWHTLLQEAYHSGSIDLQEVGPSDINKSQPSARMKKNRNAAFLTLNKKLGHVVPDYGNLTSRGVSMKVVIQYFLNRAQQFIGRNRVLWSLIKIIKK